MRLSRAAICLTASSLTARRRLRTGPMSTPFRLTQEAFVGTGRLGFSQHTLVAVRHVTEFDVLKFKAPDDLVPMGLSPVRASNTGFHGLVMFGNVEFTIACHEGFDLPRHSRASSKLIASSRPPLTSTLLTVILFASESRTSTEPALCSTPDPFTPSRKGITHTKVSSV
jgi:hypothetical protein